MPEWEDFLSETNKLPPNQEARLILGYAYKRLIEANTIEEARQFVWPWYQDKQLDINTWRGNFLAFPGYEMAFLYPSWSYAKREAFRKAYSAAGLTHLPIGIWGAYPQGQNVFDFTKNAQGYRDILIELKNDGIEPCVFVITDAVNNDTVITPKDAQKFCDYFLPKIKDLVKLTCLGWELNQVHGWSEQQDRMSGHHMLDLSRFIRWNLPTAQIWAHFQPNWWAPHYEGKKEIDWWNNAKEITGLLFQIRPESSLKLHLDVSNEDDDPSSEDGLYLALKYRGAAKVDGVKGRMEMLSKRFVMFESSRTLDRWLQIVNIVKENYC